MLKKDDVSTTVGILKGSYAGASHDLLVKRFNYKGFFHFLLKRVFGSRAQRLFNISHALIEKGLPVPEPFAYLELTWRMRDSFYLSSVIGNSESLAHIYLNDLFDPIIIAAMLGKAVAALHTAGAVHGDLKWSNILVQEQEGNMNVFFIDLDQAKLYATPKMAGIVKDLSRFYRSGLELSAEDWINSRFFPEYLAVISPRIRDALNINKIRDRAYKSWCKKGCKRKHHISDINHL